MATIKNIESINFPAMEHIVGQDIREGDLVIIKYSKSIKLVTVDKVKESKSDGIEIIFDIKLNHYFNLTQYRKGNSFVHDLYRIRF